MWSNFTLFRTFTLLFIAFNFSCQKYEENTITETTSAEESLIPERIHYQYADDAEKKELTNLLTNQLSKFGYSKKDINLEMNQNPIMERTDSNGTKSYSMLYGKIDFELPYFYNVVIKKRTDGTYETPFLVRYENELTLNSLLGKSINNISWEATVLPLKITPKTARYHEKEEDPCAVLPLSNSGNSGSFNPTITLIKNKDREEPSSPSSPIGGSKNTAILEICSPTIKTTTYECNGPNSDTDHPAGPNSGDSEDNSCGDSSTNFGGSGGGYIVGQACYQIEVEIVSGVYLSVQDYSNSIEEFKGKNYCMLSLGREAMEMSRKQNKLSSEDKDFLGKLNFYLNQTSPPAEGCDDFDLYIDDDGILKSNRIFNIIEDSNPLNGLSSRNIVFEEKCPTLGGAGINIPTQSNLLINKLNTFTLSSDPLSQEGIIFLLTPENWQIAKSIDTYVTNNNNSTKAIEFAKLALEALKNGLEKDNINFEDQIINELTGPVKDIFNYLDYKTIGTSSILQNIHLFFGNSYRENNVKYKLAKQRLNVTGSTKRSETSNTSYIITINSEHIYDRAPIEIARTILHESIHAYTMMHQVTSSESFYEIFKAYLKIEKGEDIHHTIMAQEYIIPMANALKSFDNNQEDDILYTYLAWRGIPVNLRDPSITDQMINDAIIIFRARGLTTD
ncbi:hypothetical protein [Cellulophaga sp. L1A9]|uniref:hypothetical protein n=1 Tax=Cellulophaga sp. L1A9 TaxID=2686362 RepID=UPI00131AF096|nr:hypothetical protein [Cellulophaga sp. L1A9]